MLKRKILLTILSRSLLIQASWNVSRMQGLGFAYAIAPLAAAEAEPGERETSALLARHLQRFNTHPYMAAPIIGTVSRLEAENRFSESSRSEKRAYGSLRSDRGSLLLGLPEAVLRHCGRLPCDPGFFPCSAPVPDPLQPGPSLGAGPGVHHGLAAGQERR